MKRASIETLVFIAVIIFIFHFVVDYSNVVGDGMKPSLYTNNLVLIDKLAYLFHPPERGDLISFRYPPNRVLYSIKRVIGLPGDIIKYNNTSIWVNGVQLQEPYITQAENHDSKTLKVPPNNYFILGDNRPKASDSRDWGFVSSSDIEGKVVLVLWPLDNWGRINTYNSVYDKIR